LALIPHGQLFNACKGDHTLTAAQIFLLVHVQQHVLHAPPAERHALVCAQLKLAGYGVGHKVAPVPAGTGNSSSKGEHQQQRQRLLVRG
jgi:hypothetical protein